MCSRERFGEVLQRSGLLVILDEAAQHREHIGRVVVPFRGFVAERAVGIVRGEQQHRNAICVGVVDAIAACCTPTTP